MSNDPRESALQKLLKLHSDSTKFNDQDVVHQAASLFLFLSDGFIRQPSGFYLPRYSLSFFHKLQNQSSLKICKDAECNENQPLPPLGMNLDVLKYIGGTDSFYIFKLIPRLVHPRLGHPCTDTTNDHYKSAWRTPRFSLLGS